MKTLQKAMRDKDFVILAGLPIRETTSSEDIELSLAGLGAHVDAVQVGEDHSAFGRMDSLAVASIALKCSVDPVVHLSCRDRNRLGLKSTLLGAAALGVTSVVLARGQKLPESLRGKMKGVFDTKTNQLIQMARFIGDDTRCVPSPGFLVGAYTPVIRPTADWEAPKIEEKITCGANFLQTRPCLNTKLLRSFMSRLISLKILHRVSLIVEVPLLISAKTAVDYKNSALGVRIPDPLVARIADARNPIDEGISMCAEILTELQAIPGVSGASILVEEEVEHAVAAIRLAGLGAD